MDHFTFGMFAEQEAYESEKETMVDENEAEADEWKERSRWILATFSATISGLWTLATMN